MLPAYEVHEAIIHMVSFFPPPFCAATEQNTIQYGDAVVVAYEDGHRQQGSVEELAQNHGHSCRVVVGRTLAATGFYNRYAIPVPDLTC